ncbi:STY4528 family pathogenicity island replication protein [Pseudomonas aeruginosa]|uniref:STY4528 family pathogenicity island replication protein n=1 Tax=Pseudomonas aeruginosa TaxID=287 RepID=UPI00093B553F|nr:STY4528 family pathogenicity island replication protein [Pseudomonas aeruginosa]
MRLSRFPISTLLDSASGHLEAHLYKKRLAAESGEPLAQQYSGIIFSGNPHETVPRRLLLDKRLTPLERNCWQVFRLLINDDGLTAFPTYEQLRPYLGMQPGKIASRETIAKALKVLRLTRWLSLGRRLRNDLNGQVQGNVYILHDEPVSPAEALELDPDYMQLLSQSTGDSNRAIREIGQITWREFRDDPDVGRRLPSHLEKLEGRLNHQQWALDSQLEADPAAEFGCRTLPDLPHSTPSSDAEPRQNPPSTPLVRMPNSYSTYTYKQDSVCKKPVQPRAREDAHPNWQDLLNGLEAEQRIQAVSALRRVSEDLRLPIIEQWQHRCASGTVGNPFGYLMTLIQRAVQGKFNASWAPEEPAERTIPAAERPSRAPAPPSPTTPTQPQIQPKGDTRTGSEVLSRLRDLIRPRHGSSVPSERGDEP